MVLNAAAQAPPLPQINAQVPPGRWNTAYNVFQKSLLFCTVGATIMSCIPQFRSAGILATRSISLLTATTSNFDRLKNGSLGDRVAAISKIATVSLGLAGIITSSPMLINASLVTDVAFQSFEALRAARRGNLSQKVIHVQAALVSLCTIVAIDISDNSLKILFLTLASIINAVVMLKLFATAAHNRDFTGICYAPLVILTGVGLGFTLWGIKGDISKLFYQIKTKDMWFNDSDEVVWKLGQSPLHKRESYAYKITQSGVAHKGDLLELESASIEPKVFIVETKDYVFFDYIFAHRYERINVPTHQELIFERILIPPFVGPAVAFEQTLFNNDHGIPEIEDEPNSINVHKRDQETTDAIQLLKRQYPMTPKEIQTNVDAFKAYLAALPESITKQRAVYALEGANIFRDEFGPLLPGNNDILARLWHFSNTYTPPTGVEREREMAREGIVLGLSRGYTKGGRRVCDPGKISHLVVTVLQGRLAGVNIDRVPTVIPTAQKQRAIAQMANDAVNNFFEVVENRRLPDTELRNAAERFIAARPGYDHNAFMGRINEFIRYRETEE